MGMLDGRVALVTGGSKGLGAATARLFAEAGARVVVTFANDAEVGRRAGREPARAAGHRASRTPAQDTPRHRQPRRLDRRRPRAGSTSSSTMPAAPE